MIVCNSAMTVSSAERREIRDKTLIRKFVRMPTNVKSLGSLENQNSNLDQKARRTLTVMKSFIVVHHLPSSLIFHFMLNFLCG